MAVIFGLVGLTYIITRSRLTQTLRGNFPYEPFRYLLNCAQCVGFWVGFLFYTVYTPELSHTLYDAFSTPEELKTIPFLTLAAAFIYGGLISLLSSFTVNLLELIAFSKDWLIVHMGL